MTPGDPAIPARHDASLELGVRSVGRFIAVGGGRGGVGKSLVAVNLAVYFAQLGKGVVLVDADAAGSNLHSHFGLRAARSEPDLGEDGPGAMRAALVPTSVPGLSLLPAAHDAIAPGLTLRAGRKMRWLASLRALPAEYLVIDVGPGHGDLGARSHARRGRTHRGHGARAPGRRDDVPVPSRSLSASAPAVARTRQAPVGHPGTRPRAPRRTPGSHRARAPSWPRWIDRWQISLGRRR